jgi:hypothetical protein
VQDLAHYVATKVPQDAPGQKPLLSAGLAAGSFTVAINRAALRARQEEAEEKERNEIIKAATRRLTAAHDAEDIGRPFMLKVFGWIEGNSGARADTPEMALLAEYGSRRIGLDHFVQEWCQLTAVGPPPTALPQPAMSAVSIGDSSQPSTMQGVISLSSAAITMGLAAGLIGVTGRVLSSAIVPLIIIALFITDPIDYGAILGPFYWIFVIIVPYACAQFLLYLWQRLIDRVRFR